MNGICQSHYRLPLIYARRHFLVHSLDYGHRCTSTKFITNITLQVKRSLRGKMELEMVDLDALASELGFVLKSEQKNAVESLLRGKDVFGVLPTGFGKSLIYQLFVLAKSRMPTTSSRPTMIVICPLKSIIEEQITSNEFNLSATELRFDSDTINAVRNGEVQVVYAAAEQVLNEKFTSTLHEGRWLLFSSLVVPNRCG